MAWFERLAELTAALVEGGSTALPCCWSRKAGGGGLRLQGRGGGAEPSEPGAVAGGRQRARRQTRRWPQESVNTSSFWRKAALYAFRIVVVIRYRYIVHWYPRKCNRTQRNKQAVSQNMRCVCVYVYICDRMRKLTLSCKHLKTTSNSIWMSLAAVPSQYSHRLFLKRQFILSIL